MDDARFDAFAKIFGTTHSRRRLTQVLGGLSLGGTFSTMGTSEALAAKRKGGAPCTRNGQCKTGKCVGPAGNKQCSCSKKFKACVQPAETCKQATCDFDTKLCVTGDKTNGVGCGDGKTCQDGVCSGGLTCSPACSGDKVCNSSTGFCACPASKPTQCQGNSLRCSADPNTDEERCGINCVDCNQTNPGSTCCSGKCENGCGPSTNSGCDGPCGPSCTPCSNGQLCCNLGPGTSSQCVDPHPDSNNCPPPPTP